MTADDERWSDAGEEPLERHWRECRPGAPAALLDRCVAAMRAANAAYRRRRSLNRLIWVAAALAIGCHVSLVAARSAMAWPSWSETGAMRAERSLLAELTTEIESGLGWSCHPPDRIGTTREED